MKVFRVSCAAAVLLSVAAPVFAANNGPTAEDQLQAACYPDINRLCKDAMPDEDKVTACMKLHKAEVGEKCKAAYKASGRHDN